MKRLLTMEEFDLIDFNDFLMRPIEELGLSNRVTNCLKVYGVYVIGQLTQKTHWDILKMNNLGKKGLNHINDVLNSKQLHLRA
jgi:DNA-directed RNA polymerase alpha subunit